MSETKQVELTPYKLMMKKQFLLLQHLLGLGPCPPETPVLCSDLPGSSIKDFVFICIDTEFIPDGRKLCNQDFQIGVSTLDTRDLQALAQAPLSPPRRPADLLVTNNFCFGSSEYCSRIFNRFLFGKSETVKFTEIRQHVEALIPTRDIVLVTHDGKNDMKFAKELGINIPTICTLDTQWVAQHPLQLTHRAGLKELLVTLKCPFQHMHAAGNDANFTLRVLLMLAIRNIDALNCNEEQLACISACRTVAQSPRPRSKIRSMNEFKRDYPGGVGI